MNEELDKCFTTEIVERLKKRLERNLTAEELNTFTLQRSLIAYEIILDHISDKELSKNEIESYVQEVIQENHKRLKSELKNWKKEIEEISNSVWKVALIHKSGISVEKTGTNLEVLEKEVELSAIEMSTKVPPDVTIKE